jgi:hypothetical protein
MLKRILEGVLAGALMSVPPLLAALYQQGFFK